MTYRIIRSCKKITCADCLILSQITLISLSAVSLPNEKSVPGTLLLIVDGIKAIGIQNSL